ncbi:hypothetical protein I8752_34700 [Nostocaceae cyanobacterium CENA369]|uniref:Uncharacterized protein n=1 Tax=Dendronalium phyllosphericum CENA369 TaxID=1725256 RepID=A0A8J7I8E9_9NOST|nr:hypothetical protein [Dendronalium phyllosphericum CENA369]
MKSANFSRNVSFSSLRIPIAIALPSTKEAAAFDCCYSMLDPQFLCGYVSNSKGKSEVKILGVAAIVFDGA